MKLNNVFSMITVILFLLIPEYVSATVTEEVRELQDEWAKIKYLLPDNKKESAYEMLAEKAEQLNKLQPGNAEALVWEGIILSTYAGIKGGLGALGLVKKARSKFEESINIDASAMQGSAYTSLGSLYYQVPSWPIGFGDDDKALEYLTRGLQLNPDGIDANYFYGDFLMQKEEFDKAEEAFTKAMHAPDRAGRELADQGRRKEIESALSKLRARKIMANQKKPSL